MIVISVALTQCACLLHTVLVVQLSLVEGECGNTCFFLFASALQLFSLHCAPCVAVISEQMTVAAPYFLNSTVLCARFPCTALIVPLSLERG